MTQMAVYLHPDVPVYQGIGEASKTLGIGRDTLNAAMRRARDPLPTIMVGSIRKINIPLAIEWIERSML
jgi:hypothetical protein